MKKPRSKKGKLREKLRTNLCKQLPTEALLRVSAWGWKIKISRPARVATLLIKTPSGLVKVESDLSDFSSATMVAQVLLLAG